MGLVSLGIRNVRNLAAVDLSPGAELNLIFGTNGAGKTSLLEAIHVLGRGRSFRTHRLERLLRAGSETLTVSGRIQAGAHSEVVGVERSRAGMRIRIGGRDAEGAAALATRVPLQLIQPNSHQLLEEGPTHRRRFLDWGVFHVEPRFYPAWQRYQRALRQRNAALRAPDAHRQARAWDQELQQAATAIDDYRGAYLARLQPFVGRFGRQLADLEDLQVSYRRGWSAERALAESLEEQWRHDRERGHTGSGPHRADLRFLLAGVDAASRVSRGQQKLLVTTLLLAQAALFTEMEGRECLLLVDDIAAELDAEHLGRVLGLLGNLPLQVFVTAIEPEGVLAAHPGPATVFHVEHGQVREVV